MTHIHQLHLLVMHKLRHGFHHVLKLIHHVAGALEDVLHFQDGADERCEVKHRKFYVMNRMRVNVM